MSEVVARAAQVASDSWMRIINKMTSGRWIATVGVIGAVVYSVTRSIDMPDWFVAIATFVIRDYFSDRKDKGQ